LRRRTWILASCALMSLCIFGAVLESAGSLPLLMALLVAAQVFATFSAPAIGALLTTLSPLVRGRASGWHQVGNIGAGALAGGAAIWMADRISLPVLALLCAAITFLPALAALWIIETPHPRLAPGPLFSAMFHDLRELLWSWKTMVGLVFLASPIGAGALGNLMSSLGPDFHAAASEVALVTGLGGSVLIGLGAFCGGFICDRLHRMTAYALAGILAGLCAIWLGFAPATAFTYGAGYCAYAFSTGIAYTAFTALVLEILDVRKRGAATGFSLMFCMGNLPIVYVTWLDGVGYKHFGARGLMSVDAAANLGGGLLLLLLARFCAKRWSKSRQVDLTDLTVASAPIGEAR
jgi:MFS transporter, PAT family, beta-lactamase induction signal transducer AmpG